MLGPLLLLMLTAPPVDATDEGVLYEPVQEQAPRDVFAPIEITPPPERAVAVEQPLVTPLVTPLAAPPPTPLAAPQPIPLPPPPPPPTGAGRIVGGSFAITLGLAATAVVGVEVARDNSEIATVASSMIPLGLAALGIGSYVLARGVKARRNFMDWQRYTDRRARPSGEGLLVAGVMSTVVGSVALVAASVAARDRADGMPIAFGLAGAGLGVGLGTLSWGLLRRSKYRDWRQSTFLSALSVPLPVLLRNGVAVTAGLRF